MPRRKDGLQCIRRRLFRWLLWRRIDDSCTWMRRKTRKISRL